jgi:hypothetical protein
MSPIRSVAMVTVLAVAACSEAPVGPTAAADNGMSTIAARSAAHGRPAESTGVPTGERVMGQTALIPIYNQETGGLMYGSTPKGPALWPAHPNPQAQTTFYLVVYPIGSTVGTIQCNDVPMETCPDHGPVIAGGAAQLNPAVYGDGVLGHDHLSPPHGHGFHVTEYPVLVLFTSKAAANQHLTTRAAVEAAAARGEVFLAPFTDFSFLNAIVNQRVYGNGTPWVCEAYTFCIS